MPITYFENDMKCLFCGEPMRSAGRGGGYICDPEQEGCGAYYLVSGLTSLGEATP